MATTIVFGLVPALRASNDRAGRRGEFGRVGGVARRIWRGADRRAGVAVVAAGDRRRVCSRAACTTSRTVDRGFTPGNVLLANYDPSAARSVARRNCCRSASRSCRPSPSCLASAAASLAAITPLQGGGMSTPMIVNGVSTGLEEVYFNVIAPRFFEIVGTPLLAGRDLSPNDDLNAPAVAVVNEAFVRTYLAGCSRSASASRTRAPSARWRSSASSRTRSTKHCARTRRQRSTCRTSSRAAGR